SIISFLDERKLEPYWANTSSNSMISSLIQKASKDIKVQFEDLLRHRTITCEIDEEIIFHQLDSDELSIWSLLFSSGYLKIVRHDEETNQDELILTNYEVEKTFSHMVKVWFRQDHTNYNGFIKALLRDDIEEMNAYMEEVVESLFSSFDGGKQPSSKRAPERFYHGFVLGLLVDLKGRYEITSNRESGFGRYDVMLRPLKETDDAIIMEFKIFNAKKEQDMEETVQNALQQIEDKKYEQVLLDQGIEKKRIRKYGFAFRGKEVLIG
ncbi:MAG: PD-(D/E)XK nuclease domain-containing protein, partial [Ruminococcus flavefaciens]|nr:PD-(D/E)XK nuclease domain-containing protein [Ruminococcus flavefaciens]